MQVDATEMVPLRAVRTMLGTRRLWLRPTLLKLTGLRDGYRYI